MSDNPSAFPVAAIGPAGDLWSQEGMSLRDWFASQALSNSAICTGSEPEWRLAAWFGNRGGIDKQEIVAKQAYVLADAMLAEREKSS